MMKTTKVVACNEIDVNNAVINGFFRAEDLPADKKKWLVFASVTQTCRIPSVGWLGGGRNTSADRPRQV